MIAAGILSADFASDGIGGAAETDADARSTSHVEEIHPVRNLDGPLLLEHPLYFHADAGETIDGYARGIGNAFLLTGIAENDPDFSISLYSEAKNKGGDLLATYFGDVVCRYKVAQYIWNLALLFDIQQAGNIYYEFTSRKDRSFDFVIKLLGIRIR